jgi:transcriptional regulator with XRE-family HTH domain
VTNVTELLCRLIEENGSTKADLARRMGVSPGRVSQLLDGHANLTLSSIARALAAFDCVLSVNAVPLVARGESARSVDGWTVVNRSTGGVKSSIPLESGTFPSVYGFAA